ncbi:MAG: hypothetical protein CMA31_03385 [Euryarchaeota archaeon]|jgi:hypothetical protein|nr:hypothetical protein [Euryarchaeota archaeon]|tara:strand:+ start:474 stop:1175 length:702 start_codon:yes stop_codon:yes gene_type:complete
MILNEGGNIFKNAEGEPATIRINKADVKPTLAWLEKITKLDHRNHMLGSTGVKDTSGDLDVAIDKEKVDKNELTSILQAWVVKNYPDEDPKEWIRKSGISVHFKTPINGDPKNGFVQTDLMFGDQKFMGFALKGDATSTFKGQHRMIMIASLAKAQGYKWSPQNGLVDRITNEPVDGAKNPDKIAKTLMGPTASAKDMQSVETINAKIKSDPNYDALVQDARDWFEKDGLELP